MPSSTLGRRWSRAASLFEDGLALLERAYEVAPGDPGVNYSLGWCYEFVAYRLEKDARRPYRDPIELYELAATHLQRCIDLNPEQGLKDDAQDLLIRSSTGCGRRQRMKSG